MGGGFFVGILIGYALKKVVKIVTVIVGLFLAGLAYLQYHQLANINWNKPQIVSEGAITTLSNSIIQIKSSSDGHAAVTAVTAAVPAAAAASSSLAMTSFGIPLTSSMSAGFTNGFV